MKPDPSLKGLVAYAFDQLERVPRDNPRLILCLNTIISDHHHHGRGLTISTQLWGKQQNESVHYACDLDSYAKIDEAVAEIIRALADYSPEAELARAEKALKAAEHRLAEARKAAA